MGFPSNKHGNGKTAGKPTGGFQIVPSCIKPLVTSDWVTQGLKSLLARYQTERWT